MLKFYVIINTTKNQKPKYKSKTYAHKKNKIKP